jgi:protein gp37
MGKETGISWTDHTFNPWWGCTKVSPGCDHCYAETVDAKWGGVPHWGKGVPRMKFGAAHWRQPLAWNKAAGEAGEIRKVFCASMADVMDDEAPAGERERLWDLIDRTPNLVWQLLTKRPQRYMRYLPQSGFEHNNVWLGTTAENQRFYFSRIEELVEAEEFLGANKFEGVTTFVSYEPALGPISMRGLEKPDWLIFGGETGGDRRPMNMRWAENIRDECAEFGVSFFMKQMSAFAPAQAAKLIPAELLILQFPTA